MKKPGQTIGSLLFRVWKVLSAPNHSILLAEDRRRAVFITVVSLFSFLAVLVEQQVGGNTPFSALVFLFLAYLLARTRWFKIAGMLLLATLSVPSFLVVLRVPAPDVNRVLTPIVWTAIPMIVCSLIYSVRTTIAFSLINMLLLAVLPLLREELGFDITGAALGFYGLISLAVVIVMVQRNEIENDRQKELIENRNALADEVIQRERFAMEAQRRADQLAMLNEIGRLVSSLQGLDETLEMIVRQVQRRIPLDVFYTALYDEQSGLVTFPIILDDGRKWTERSSSLEEAPFISRVIQDGTPLLWNMSPEEIKNPDIDKRVGDLSKTTASILISPLTIGARRTGVISAQSYTPNLYNDEHLTLLTAIAQQVAIAIENAHLFEQTRIRAGRLAILNEISREISTITDLPTLLENVYTQVNRSLPADLFFIGLYDHTRNELSFPIMYDGGRRWQQRPSPVTEGTFSGQVILTGKPLLRNGWSATNMDNGSTATIIGDRTRVTQSVMFAPMLFGRETIGIISVQSYRINAFADEDLNLLTSIGNQVATAIQNTRLLEETRQNALQLSILNELGNAVSELRDLPDLLQVIYEQVKRNLSVDAFYVGLYEEGANTVHYPIMYDEGIRYDPTPDVLEPDSYLYRLLHGEKAKMILRTREEIQEPHLQYGMVGNQARKSASLLFAPLKVGEQVIGMISAQSYTLNAYTKEDLSLLVGIGNQVGVAIQNAGLLEETRQKTETLQSLFQKAERQAQELALLGKIQDALSQEIELADLMQAVVKSISSAFGYKYISLYLLEGKSLHLQHQVGYDEEKVIATIPLDQGISGRVIQSSRPVFIEDVESDNEFLRAASDIKSEICVPLFEGETICGTLNVECADEPLLTREDFRLLLLVGNQVNTAIRRARLVEEIKQNVQHLSILNEVGQAVAKIMDLSELLEVIYKQGRKSISLDAFFVGLYHPEDEEVSFPIMYDSGVRYEQTRGAVSKNSFLRRFLNGEKPILMLRTEKELEEGITYQKTLGRENKLSASLMAAPLLSRGQVIGLISAQSYTLNAYDKNDLKLLEGIASQVAIAIENSRLYASAQQEIRERERAELELQRERDFAVQVMNTLGQGVSVSLLDGVYEYVNPAYANMLGYTPEEMVGETAEKFAHPDDVAGLKEERAQRLLGRATTYEKRLLHKNGQVVHVLVTGVPRYSNGKIIGSITAITDLSERHQTEIERENLLAEMERKHAELERFTYTVSHDLKSPLVTIAGFLGFLEEDIRKQEYGKLPRTMERIREAAKKMQRLLEELLELSRVGRIVNPPVDVPFGELAQETLELVDGQLRERQVEVRVEAGLPVVRVDHVRMVEVLQNLIVNAIKFMGNQPHPLIEIGFQPGDREHVFYVRDNGAGIAPEFHQRIFGLFNKLDPYSDGTGIGLALVKRIIEVHGGKIWVQSEPGKGATFFFTLGESTKQETI